MSKEQDDFINVACQRLQLVFQMQGKGVKCNPNNLLINWRPLESSKGAANQLMEFAKVDGKDDLIDLEQAGYPKQIQDYIIKYLYDRDITPSQEQLDAIIFYKSKRFDQINDLMRENPDKFKDGNVKISELVKNILSINEFAKSVPPRKYDLVLRRIGSGSHAENQYDSFVSFGTDGGTAIGTKKATVRYKKVLKRDEPSIPVEKITPDALLDFNSECEIITLPFKYSVLEAQENENQNESTSENLTIGQEEQLKVEDILLGSLNKFKELGIEGVDEAIQLVQDVISREEVNAEEKISQVVEGKKSPKLTAIKNVVRKVREKIVNRGKTEGDRNDFN